MYQTTATTKTDDASQNGSRILVVDDDVNLTRLLRAILRTSGFDVVTCGDSTEGLSVAESQDFNLIILDLRMPVMDGRTFYKELRERGVKTPVVIASAYGARAAQAGSRGESTT